MTETVQLALIGVVGSAITGAITLAGAWVAYKTIVKKKLDESTAATVALKTTVAAGNAATSRGNEIAASGVALLRQAATEVKEVKATLVETTEATALQLAGQGEQLANLNKVTSATLVHVNSAQTRLLRLHATSARTLSNNEPDNAAYRELADAADRMLADQLDNQAALDQLVAPLAVSEALDAVRRAGAAGGAAPKVQ